MIMAVPTTPLNDGNEVNLIPTIGVIEHAIVP